MKNILKFVALLSCFLGAAAANAGAFFAQESTDTPALTAALLRCDHDVRGAFLKFEQNGPGGVYHNASANALNLRYDAERKELVSFRHLYASQAQVSPISAGFLSVLRFISPTKIEESVEKRPPAFLIDLDTSVQVDPKAPDVRNYLISVLIHNKIYDFSDTEQACDINSFQFAMGQVRTEVAALKSCELANPKDAPFDKNVPELFCDGKKLKFSPALINRTFSQASTETKAPSSNDLAADAKP